MHFWTTIKGYEGLYSVSRDGDVRSHRSGKLLKSSTTKAGYKSVTLCKDGASQYHYVHRLVADAFIENMHNHPIVNHKDENPTNNKVDNLELCTQKHNINYGSAQDRKSYKIEQCDIDGRVIKVWRSSMDCHRKGFHQSAIWACCHNRFNKIGNNIYKGYIWRYKNRKMMENNINIPLSFNKGLRHLNDYQKEEAKTKIMERIGITSDIGYNNRRLGKVRHDVISAKVIEAVFAEYKVRPKDVWGD